MKRSVHFLLLSFFSLSLLASCIGVGHGSVVLSSINESASFGYPISRHSLKIDENRMLIYNGEEKMFVPVDKEVVFEVYQGSEPTFTLRDK